MACQAQARKYAAGLESIISAAAMSGMNDNVEKLSGARGATSGRRADHPSRTHGYRHGIAHDSLRTVQRPREALP